MRAHAATLLVLEHRAGGLDGAAQIPRRDDDGDSALDRHHSPSLNHFTHCTHNLSHSPSAVPSQASTFSITTLSQSPTANTGRITLCRVSSRYSLTGTR